MSLCDGLAENDLGDVLIGSTGIYWIPVYDMPQNEMYGGGIAKPSACKADPWRRRKKLLVAIF